MEIREEIQDIFHKVRNEVYNHGASLIKSRLVDSLDIVEVVTMIEERFSIKIDGEEVTVQNFDTILKIEEFVQRKLAD